MNKKAVVDRVVEILKSNDIRKPVQGKKVTLHISDDEGTTRDFSVRVPAKSLLLNGGDVEPVLNAFFAVVEEALKNGERVYLHGFGTFGLDYRPERTTRLMQMGPNGKMQSSSIPVTVEARYVPKFKFGNELRMAARTYGLLVKDKTNSQLPVFEDDIEDDDDDDFEEVTFGAGDD